MAGASGISKGLRAAGKLVRGADEAREAPSIPRLNAIPQSQAYTRFLNNPEAEGSSGRIVTSVAKPKVIDNLYDAFRANLDKDDYLEFSDRVDNEIFTHRLNAQAGRGTNDALPIFGMDVDPTSMDLVVYVDDEAFVTLAAQRKLNIIDGRTDDMPMFDLNWETIPWEQEELGMEDWIHSGRISFRDMDGDEIFRTTMDEFQFPFDKTIPQRRNSEAVKEYWESTGYEDFHDNSSIQALGNPGARDEAIRRTFKPMDDEDEIVSVEDLDRQMHQAIIGSGPRLTPAEEAMERRARTPIGGRVQQSDIEYWRNTTIAGDDQFDYRSYKALKDEGAINLPNNYKEKSPFTFQQIEDAFDNMDVREVEPTGDLWTDPDDVPTLQLSANIGSPRDPAGRRANVGDLVAKIYKDEGAVAISWSYIPGYAAGSGRGLRLYGKVVDYAKANGYTLSSDNSVSGNAVHMYEAMVRRGGKIEDQRVTNPDNVVVNFSPWHTGTLVPQYRTLDNTPLIRVTKLPDHLPAIMMPVAPLSLMEQNFLEGSPYQGIMYDKDGDNPYLFRGRQPFKMGVSKEAPLEEKAAAALEWLGWSQKQRRQLELLASGQYGPEGEKVLHDALSVSGFDHILHTRDADVTYWDESLALKREGSQDGN